MGHRRFVVAPIIVIGLAASRAIAPAAAQSSAATPQGKIVLIQGRVDSAAASAETQVKLNAGALLTVQQVKTTGAT